MSFLKTCPEATRLCKKYSELRKIQQPVKITDLDRKQAFASPTKTNKTNKTNKKK
jgi:hypothetical protein